LARKQWHPLFARLLRPLVEDYYQVETNMPVGDLPREADLVLLRRTGQVPPPFQGLWKNLTTWNVLEYKGRAVSARLEDLDLLVELGLGINRRLNEERTKQSLAPLGPEEVAFWYIANHLGQRFLRDCQDMLGTLESVGSGVWRCHLLRRMVFLVSSAELPVEPDSVPLHIVGQAPLATEVAVAHLLRGQPALWERYGRWLLTLHPELWEEVRVMATIEGLELDIDLKPLIEHMGLGEIVKQVGPDAVIEEIGLARIIEHYGVDRLLAQLTEAQRQESKPRPQ
jgi:hypothetical protein